MALDLRAQFIGAHSTKCPGDVLVLDLLVVAYDLPYGGS